jgi:mono/diheme cytochrome c family protein
MKKIIWITAGVAGLLLLVGAGLTARYALSWPPSYPETPLPHIQTTDDPATLARGKYLVEAVAHCGACHTPTEEYYAWEAGTPMPSPAGGHGWHMGPIGTLRAANITSDTATGIGAWSDAEIARAIRHGVRKDGRPALFMMSVGPMSDEDLTAVVSYVRTLAPVGRQVPPHEIGIMGKVLFQTAMSFFAAPHDYQGWLPPVVREGGVSLERGRYLAEGPAFCVGCHSDYEVGDEGPRFTGQVGSGGHEAFPDETDPAFEFIAPNLTREAETGHLHSWNEQQFVSRLVAGRLYEGSPMPWESYRNLTEDDRKSLWLWVESLPPTKKVLGPPRRAAGWKPEG